MSGRERLLSGDRFVRALQAAGLLPDNVTAVDIRARVFEPVTITYGVDADERLLGIVGGLEITDDPAKAVAH